jgi:hypothetical protein
MISVVELGKDDVILAVLHLIIMVREDAVLPTWENVCEIM